MPPIAFETLLISLRSPLVAGCCEYGTSTLPAFLTPLPGLPLAHFFTALTGTSASDDLGLLPFVTGAVHSTVSQNALG